jgi:hypothetical protein
MRVLVVNFQSIRAKRTSFWLLLEEVNPDIIIGSETWLYPAIFEREVLPAGYHFISRKDRTHDRHGGVIIAAKDTIIGTDLNIRTPTEFTAASFVSRGKDPLIIASIYRPPNTDQAYMEEVCSQFRHLHLAYPTSTIWLAGDVNLPDIDWNSCTITGNNNPKQTNQLLLDAVLDTSSEQMVCFPTRGNNTLDLFITNRPTLIEKCKPLPGISDHDAVFIQAQTTASRLKLPSRKILLWKKANTADMSTAIRDFSSDFTTRYTQDTDVNTLWKTFRDFVDSTIQAHVPSKMTSTRFSQPWISRKAKRLSRRKKRAYHRAKSTGSEEDTGLYKQACKDTRYECRKAYNSYISDMVTTDRNPKKLYSLVKGKRCDSSGISPLKSDGVAHSDPATKAAILNDQFCSVFSREASPTIPSLGNSPYPDMPSFTIGVEGVRKLLADLDPHKATGPDNIPTKFLKDNAEGLAPALTLLFSATVTQGEVPSDWRHANVTPIFKKGDRSNPANYRPISLTCVCSKMIEHILHSQIMTHLDKHRILADQQHGFRKKRSTESQLILTLHDLSKSLDEGEQIDAILLDFSKAFDKVPHERLASKLGYYGIRGTLLQWIRSFLANRTQQVLVEGKSSDTAPVTSGVPQGSVIGPLLFLLYINDLPLQTTSTTRLFADDSFLYRKIRTTEDAKALQEDLDRLQQWERDWLMSFNPSKCEVIRITRKRNPIRTTYYIHGSELQLVKGGRYLGVHIDEKLTLNTHVAATAKKANNSLAFLRRNLTSCPQDVKAQCYQTLVRPILEYAGTAWDPHTKTSINQLEAVQRRAARFVTGNYHTTSSTSQMVADLGWQPLAERRSNAKLVMVFRITHGLVDIPAENFFHPTASTTRGHNTRYLLPFCRTDAYLHSFFPSAIRLWNQLPVQATTVDSVEAFRSGLVASW